MSQLRASRIPLFVEATPLLDVHLSGIGHLLLSFLEELSIMSDTVDLDIILVVPFDKMSILKPRTDHLKVRYKSVPMPARVMYVLMKYNLLPPLDMWLGTGVYLFPNYRNWRLKNSRSITYIHDMAFRVLPHTVSPRNQAFLQRNMPAWLKQTNTVIALSKQTKHDITKYYDFPAKDIAIVPCGIDPKLFYQRSPSEIAKTKQKYGIKSSYLMFLSTIEPRKNLVNLLQAYEQLPLKIRNTQTLVLVGANGWLSEDITGRIRDMQARGLQVIWPKVFVPDEDIPPLLSGATALLLPSFYEGFGIPLLEAMACRTAVVAARNSSMPDVVGDTGLYVDAENVQDMCDKFAQVVENSKERERLAVAGYERSKQFTWAAAATQLVKVIQNEAAKLGKGSTKS